VKSDGQVVVADFGLSRINLEDDDDTMLTSMNDGSSFRREQRSASTTLTSNGSIVVVRPKTRRQLLRDRQRSVHLVDRQSYLSYLFASDIPLLDLLIG
jgi:hypothetical protein